MSNLTIIRGDSEVLNITWQDADGVAIDLTGKTIFFTAKKLDSDSDDDAVITAQNSVHDDAEKGITHISLSSSDTDVEPRDYYYDFQLVDLVGNVLSTPSQVLTVLQDITIREA